MKKIKRKHIEKMLARASSGLYFLDHFLNFSNQKADDIAWQRSILILLSHNFELILKSSIIYISESQNEEDLKKELYGYNHDIDLILDKLKEKDFLELIGISDYQKISNPFISYKINMNNGNKIFIENIVDVRYDFVKEGLRNLISDEDIKISLQESLVILIKIRSLI